MESADSTACTRRPHELKVLLLLQRFSKLLHTPGLRFCPLPRMRSISNGASTLWNAVVDAHSSDLSEVVSGFESPGGSSIAMFKSVCTQGCLWPATSLAGGNSFVRPLHKKLAVKNQHFLCFLQSSRTDLPVRFLLLVDHCSRRSAC